MTDQFIPSHRITVFYRNGDTEYCPVMLCADGTAPDHRSWASNRPGDWSWDDSGKWLFKGQDRVPDGGLNFRVDLVQPQPWCEPYEAGLASEAKAVGRTLGELLTALDSLETIVRGTLPHELRDFRLSLHDRLKAEGWRITAKQNGWKVLPPKR